MKKIILALLLLLIAGCSNETVFLEEVSDNIITGDVVAEPIDTNPYYEFFEGETKIILGHEITISKLLETPEALIKVDGVSARIIETKNEEIINGMKISTDKIDYSDINNLKIILKIEELNLKNNEYIISQNIKTRIKDKDILLTNSKSNGNIYVIVYDINNIKSEDDSIAKGETIELNGLQITNLKNYYKTNQYAIVQVVES